MSDVVVDSDVLIDVARNNPVAAAHIYKLSQNYTLVISAITYMEVIVGVRSKIELLQTKQFLTQFAIIKLNADISDIAMGLLETYRLSHGLQIPDALIAATAIWMKVPLSSKNQRDFRFISRLNLLPYP